MPYTFVNSNLAPESMETGRIPSIEVDNPESAANVTRYMKLEDYQVPAAEKAVEGWKIVVKKA